MHFDTSEFPRLETDAVPQEIEYGEGEGADLQMDRAAIVQAFLRDAEANVLGMAESLAAIAAEPDGEAAMYDFHVEVRILRSNAQALDHARLAELAHATDRVLHSLRSHFLTFSEDLHATFQRAVVMMALMVPCVCAPVPRLPQSYAAVLAELQSLILAPST